MSAGGRPPHQGCEGRTLLCEVEYVEGRRGGRGTRETELRTQMCEDEHACPPVLHRPADAGEQVLVS